MVKIFFGTLLFGSVAFANSESLGTRPKECNYNRSTKKGPRMQTVVCNDFDLKYKNSYTNVCVYKNGSWQFGHLKYNKSKGSHQFSAIRVCDQGIVVIPEQNTLDLRSPAIGDVAEGKTDLVTLSGKVWTSLIKEAPVQKNEVPILCYRTESRGVAVNAVACSRYPNEVNYCEFADLGHRNYKGNWWVQYRKASKGSPVTCLGGVKVANLSDAAGEYAESQIQVQVEKASAGDFLKLLPKPEVDQPGDLEYQVAACYAPNVKGVSTRYSCANESVVSFDNWVNSESDLRAKVTQAVMSAKPKERFFSLYPSYDAAFKAFDLRAKLKLKLPSGVFGPSVEDVAGLRDDLNAEIEQQLLKVAEQNEGKYPFDRTSLKDNDCGISWEPGKPSQAKVYIRQKAAGKVTSKECEKVEYYKKRDIAG